jgi:hypothetical protein
MLAREPEQSNSVSGGGEIRWGEGDENAEEEEQEGEESESDEDRGGDGGDGGGRRGSALHWGLEGRERMAEAESVRVDLR